MSTRTDLQEIIERAILGKGIISGARDATEAIVKAGWRPPMRVVSTVEELEALPVGAVIFNRNGESLQIQDNYGKEFYYAAADETPYGAHFLFEVGDGPFRVVWEPEQ